MPREMRIGLLAVSSVLLILLCIGVYQAFSRPAVTEEPLMVDYQHIGEFDYTAYCKPSYVYGTSQAMLSSTKYPINLIENIGMTYDYHSDKTAQREVEVNAVIERTGIWEKTVPLVPKETQTGDFTLSFTVDLTYFQELAQTIDEEIGVHSTSNYDVRIIASVTDVEADDVLTSQNINQTLLLGITESFIYIDGNLVHRYGNSYGKYDYTVQLKPNTLYDSTTLKPPTVSEDSVTKTLGPEDTVFLKLLDGIVFSFSHWLQADVPITLLEEEVEITATIEIPGKWSKVVVLVPATEISGLADITFPVDLTQLTEILDTVQWETGISASARNLTIGATVRTLAQTDFGLIDDEYTQSLMTDLTGSILNWSNGLENTEPRSFETAQTIERQEKYMWLPVTQARILFPILAAITCVLFVFCLVMCFRTGSELSTDIEQVAGRVTKQYRNIIVDTNEISLAIPTENIVLLDSLDDLIKVAQGLLKPVLHKVEKGQHTYCVLDAATCYEYVIIGETTLQGDQLEKKYD